MPNRREEALKLAGELLSDVELHRISPIDVARKASRLARLLDDGDGMAWLRYETSGYPTGGLDPDAWAAALRSRRDTLDDDGTRRAYCSPLGKLQLDIDSGLATLSALTGVASGEWAMGVEASRARERQGVRNSISAAQSSVDQVVGSIHEYVLSKYQELRFGSAVETSFEIVRAEVDARIASLVPDALPMLSAALENATSDSREHWANAASTCRRLLKLVADAIRPPGPPVATPSGKAVQMGDGNYINRLVDWIAAHSESETMAGMISRDLEHLGERLDAADKAGQKGAHDQVGRFEASRYITGTYLLLGDLLRLSPETQIALAIERPAGTTVVAEAMSSEVNGDRSRAP